MNELWRDVRGYDGKYSVSNLGRIRSNDRTVKNWPRGERFIKGKIIGEKIIFKGKIWYVFADLRKSNRERKRAQVHRLVAEAFIPNPNNKPCVNHIDGIKNNNLVENLEWCTHKENMEHASRLGLMPKGTSGPGEKSPAAKLNNEQVVEIKKRILSGEGCRDIARDFPVGESAIGEIAAGRSWAHITV